MNEMKTIGERLRYLLTKNKMKQKELASILNVTPATVSKWLKGDNLPNEHLSRITEIFNISADVLLGMTPFDEEQVAFAYEPFEHIKTIELPATELVYADIIKDNIENDYGVWIYDLRYGGIKIPLDHYPLKNNTPAMVEEKFKAKSTELLKKYRDLLDYAAITTATADDRREAEEYEAFLRDMEEMHQELGID